MNAGLTILSASQRLLKKRHLLHKEDDENKRKVTSNGYMRDGRETTKLRREGVSGEDVVELLSLGGSGGLIDEDGTGVSIGAGFRR
uniref:Uncharacterized protein n=1 Tax=Brassica campestris TaxID=3711 RepID=M4DV73_BRACM|nr:unnamed protein product [Brassica rapa]